MDYDAQVRSPPFWAACSPTLAAEQRDGTGSTPRAAASSCTSTTKAKTLHGDRHPTSLCAAPTAGRRRQPGGYLSRHGAARVARLVGALLVRLDPARRRATPWGRSSPEIAAAAAGCWGGESGEEQRDGLGMPPPHRPLPPSSPSAAPSTPSQPTPVTSLTCMPAAWSSPAAGWTWARRTS